jgi:hypothetical protein
MRRWLYLHVLWNVMNVKSDIERRNQAFPDRLLGSERRYVMPDEVIEGSCYPRWLIRLAVRWQEREFLKSEKPPFSL